MDIGSITRVTGPAPVPEVVRTTASSSDAGVPPQLGLARAVGQGEQSPSAENGGEGNETLDRRVIIDPDTREFVSQQVNGYGDVVRQTPDLAMLRQRAYLDQLSEAEAASAALGRSGEGADALERRV